MYLVIHKSSLIAGKGEEWMQRVQAGLVPLLQAVPGFRARYDVEVRDDEVVSISLFETQGEWEAAQPRTASWFLTQVTPLLQTFPEITTGQVKASSEPLHLLAAADEVKDVQWYFA
jgi:hypothetical protein